MNPVWLSPDCRDGNCHKCDGKAWNEVDDRPAMCRCSCHYETKEAS